MLELKLIYVSKRVTSSKIYYAASNMPALDLTIERMNPVSFIPGLPHKNTFRLDLSDYTTKYKIYICVLLTTALFAVAWCGSVGW